MSETFKVKKIHPGKIISLGFLLTIIVGTLLLLLPISIKDGVDVSFVDALFTSTSAVCVTGLVVVDVADTFTIFGQIVIAFLIQIGGLGVSSIGAGIILALGRKFNMQDRKLVKEALKVNSTQGIIKLVRSVFLTTLIFELVGMILSFIVFIQEYDFLKALGMAAFHSIAAFNNSGFDLFGSFKSMTDYSNNILLNLTTAFLIIAGGLGFLVIRDLINNKFRWKKLSLHSKIVLSTSGFLIVIGTIIIYISEHQNISLLSAFFHSVSARTAGFATFDLSKFSLAGLMSIMILMFIGASPGSTGGGIKTTTFFVAFKGVFSVARNKNNKAFKYTIPEETFKKSCIVILLAISIVLGGTYFMSIFESGKDIRFVNLLFEVVSAFGTVGLSTGITQSLEISSRILIIIIMFIGRLGPLTIVSYLNVSKVERIRYPEGNISIG